MKLKDVKPKGRYKGVDTSTLLSAKLSLRNETALIALLKGYEYKEYACLVPFSLERTRSSVTVLYNTKSLVNLTACFAMPTKAGQFASMVESLLNAFNQIDDLGIPLDYLNFEVDKVYLNSVAGSMAFLLYSYDSGRRPIDPTYYLFRALGTEMEPASYDERMLFERYVNGIDRIKGQGLAGYRWYARDFVNEIRGKTPVADEEEDHSQKFSRDVFYDANLAAVNAEISSERMSGPRTMYRNGTFKSLTLRDPEGRLYSIDILPCTFGSSKDVDFRIESGWVSRHHARIALDGDTLLLEDLDSTNGTMLNGRKVIPGRGEVISDGDIIEFADRKFTAIRL